MAELFTDGRIAWVISAIIVAEIAVLLVWGRRRAQVVPLLASLGAGLGLIQGGAVLLAGGAWWLAGGWLTAALGAHALDVWMRIKEVRSVQEP